MTNKFFFLDDDKVEILFIRDADSRIEERDRWCINQFLQSNYHLHIIRDHYHHRRLMMGAMWGIKKTKKLDLEKNYNSWKNINSYKIGTYYSDQDFIDEYIYPLYKDDMLIHSNLIGFIGETVTPIKIEMKDDRDFVGNVYEYDSSGRKYLAFSWKGYDYTELCKWLFSQGQMELFHNSRRLRTCK